MDSNLSKFKSHNQQTDGPLWTPGSLQQPPEVLHAEKADETGNSVGKVVIITCWLLGYK